MTVPVIVDKVGKFVVKNLPTIAISVGIIGFVGTVALAIDESPKATKALENLKKEKEEVKFTDEVKVLAPIYWPMVTTGVFSIGCIIFANKVSLKRYAAMVAAYQLSESALTDVKEKMEKVLGKKKTTEVLDEVAKDKMRQNPVSKNQVIIIGDENQLFYDALSGRYFHSSAETVRQAVNKINQRLLIENTMTLNEFYDELNIPGIELGDSLGWNLRAMDDLLQIYFTADKTDDERPCLILEYSVVPTHWYAD